jgi:hypothetical protein
LASKNTTEIFMCRRFSISNSSSASGRVSEKTFSGFALEILLSEMKEVLFLFVRIYSKKYSA